MNKDGIPVELVILTPMNKALEYYKNQLSEITSNNITVKFGYQHDANHAYGFFNPNDKTINIAINIPGKTISPKLNYKGNLKSTLIHEYYHWLDNEEKKPSGTLPRIHMEVVFRQIKHNTAEFITSDRQDELLRALCNHLTDHWKAGAFEQSYNDEVKERALKVYKPYLKSKFNKDLQWTSVREGNEIFIKWYYK